MAKEERETPAHTLTGCVQWVDGGHDQAGFQRAQGADHKVRTVGQHERDHIVRLEPELRTLQSHGESGTMIAQRGEGERSVGLTAYL